MYSVIALLLSGACAVISMFSIVYDDHRLAVDMAQWACIAFLYSRYISEE